MDRRSFFSAVLATFAAFIGYGRSETEAVLNDDDLMDSIRRSYDAERRGEVYSLDEWPGEWCGATGFVPGQCHPGCGHWEGRHAWAKTPMDTACHLTTIPCPECKEFKMVIDGEDKCVNGRCSMDLSSEDFYR